MSEWFERFGFTEVAEGLLVGAYPVDADDVAAIAGAGAQVLVNLCEDVEYREGERSAVGAALAHAGIDERRLPVPDYGNLPEDTIDRAVRAVVSDLEAGRTVYLHCRAGWQRSATIAAGAVAVREGLGIEQALDRVRERKPTAEPLAHQRADLLGWWRRRSVGAGS
ncbi:MAG: dual specificity protein phosphatase family protein [Actinomycetota bacterium]|nr:dual specificity protein phosphatase family protein [Actinomycetota bacterium]